MIPEEMIPEIKTMIQAHINSIKNIELQTESPLYQQKANLLSEYMRVSPLSKKFFELKNPDILLQRYLKELQSISNGLGDSRFSSKEKILNFMEYIRLNGMSENISDSILRTKGINAIAELSQTGLNIALLGKGVCKSQAQFLEHLLRCSGIDATNKQIIIRDLNDDVAHEVVKAKTTEQDSYFLDPTWYNGILESIKGYFDNLNPTDRGEMAVLDITQEDIDKARENAQHFLIERYKIKDISEQLELDKAKDDMEKQIRILAYMGKNLVPTSDKIPLNIRSVNFENREVEVGKLLELFYKANNIQYQIKGEAKTRKSEVTYSTTYDLYETQLILSEVFDSIKVDGSISRLHNFISKDGRITNFCEMILKDRRIIDIMNKYYSEAIKIIKEKFREGPSK